MKKILLIAVLILTAFANTSSTMKQSSFQNFEAQYKVWTPKETKTINYYRYGAKVAYEYPVQGITEVWTQMPNNRATLVRGFDHDKRSIEYDTIDLKMEKKNSTWKQHANIMSPKNFKFNSVVQQTINDIEVLHYSKKEGSRVMDMYWDTQRDLLFSFSIKENNVPLFTYQLISVEKKSINDSHVAQVLAYDTTDFADIGDNESDPFFRKMINLGFIAHHEANIIDANGNNLELAHNH